MKLRKYIYILLFVGGIALTTFSLLPFFRALSDTFWIATIVGFTVSVVSLFMLMYKPRVKEGEVELSSKYTRKKLLISRPEYDFLQLLRMIKPEKYEVVPQVALVSVIDKKTNTAYRNELFRVCDYAFVDRDTFEPLLLVELNDNSHKRSDRRDRDAKVAAICKDAGLPLITFWMSDNPSFDQVKKTVLRYILR